MGKDIVFLKGLATESLTMLQRVYEQHKIELFFSSSVLGTVTRFRDKPGRIGCECAE